jgi:Uma2 family endonuclease
MSATIEPQVHRFTVKEYRKMAEADLFAGNYVELIDGKVIEIAAMGNAHRTAVILAGDLLRETFGKGFFVSVQCPFEINEVSEPEADLAVIKGTPRQYKDAPLTTAVLIVEVSDSSLKFDRTVNAGIYAVAGMKEYWIINLDDRRLEVYRKPIQDPSQPSGFGYSEIKILTEKDSIKPLVAKSEIAVADLLP